MAGVTAYGAGSSPELPAAEPAPVSGVAADSDGGLGGSVSEDSVLVSSDGAEKKYTYPNKVATPSTKPSATIRWLRWSGVRRGESSSHNCQPYGGGPHAGSGSQSGGGVHPGEDSGQLGGGLYRAAMLPSVLPVPAAGTDSDVRALLRGRGRS